MPTVHCIRAVALLFYGNLTGNIALQMEAHRWYGTALRSLRRIVQKGTMSNSQSNPLSTDSLVWNGWGVSLAWWANIFGDRADLVDVVFTRNPTSWNPDDEALPGLGLKILRYNTGACSWNTINDTVKMVASPNIPAAKQIEGYWLDGLSADPSSSSWNWTVDANQRTIMLNTKIRGANTFEIFSNSPMWWQLSNLNPSSASDRTKYTQDNWGLIFTSIEALNKPTSLIPILQQEIKAPGLDQTIIAAPDKNTFELALDGKTLVLVAANWNTDQKFNFDLSAFSQIPADGAKVSSWLTDTAGNKLYDRDDSFTVEKGVISLSIANSTAQIFEISGVAI
ncbi:endo-beta-1 6-galactanase [Penicillium angulare]|uniref:endo-beta-1 6-galactanase n=1 Tax=Penicillium angulare TaxID=116970 RepID=UPI0025403DA5|nr:endo-beta-1 6-galactanase [Penicillium angulare]KAJ5288653.1 endo-beta-1 6-galactanase [Penicillium angulare]